MSSVYQNAHLTIAATAFASSEEGILRRPSSSLIRVTTNGGNCACNAQYNWNKGPFGFAVI